MITFLIKIIKFHQQKILISNNDIIFPIYIVFRMFMIFNAVLPLVSFLIFFFSIGRPLKDLRVDTDKCDLC